MSVVGASAGAEEEEIVVDTSEVIVSKMAIVVDG